MSKYDVLRAHLARLGRDHDEARMSFAEIEKIVGPLPPSAREYRPWWGNSSHPQAQAWQAAGWIVDSVNLTAELVVFVRGQAVRRLGFPVVTRRVDDPSPAAKPSAMANGETDGQSEAAVQAQLVTHLAREGWHIQRVADTATREQGIDVLATKPGRTLAVEVKGWPSRD
jgi:hypothetical protein